MNKKILLTTLYEAKEVHQDQMSKIELLLQGLYVTKPTELSKMECEFGKIFYGNKELFLPFIGEQFFTKVDALHEEWHLQYENVYKIAYAKRKRGFFARLRGGDEIKSAEYLQIEIHFEKLQQITSQLLDMIDKSMRRVEALSDAKFKS